ncbi:hypothetical protein [Heyndrickxia oleronia]|uniref:Uncharacterized protein n=1 Tax=Heyndrickxia oleronia TaxID=38875 RepID=A0AAW6SQN1_9BACI|nr:hypothetical protein [Heyndrickxia oleronia]MDH5159557.1 hypothetical protein [Heyndrickxia oleronia]
MDSVFVMSQLEEMVKAPRLLGDLLVKGLVCPFLSKLHIENSCQMLFAP